MHANLTDTVARLKRSIWLSLCLCLLGTPAFAEPDINLKGVIDFHVHSGPDSTPRTIDADDLARLAKKSGMRGLVLKNHFEPTVDVAYLVRKQTPGLEVFGGITMDLSKGEMT